MPTPYCYEYPRPSVTVDLVCFAIDAGRLATLLIRRDRDPFAGRWAIPGGFLEMDEPAEVGARRELLEETGLVATGPIAAIGFYDAPGRDPRGRTISLAFATSLRGPAPSVSGGDDAREAAWLPVGSLEPLAFDHDRIVADALAWLGRAVAEGPAGLALMPAGFGDDDVRTLFRAVGLPDRGVAAWRRRIEKRPAIRP